MILQISGVAASVVWRCAFFFSSRTRHTRCSRDWSSDVCSSDLGADGMYELVAGARRFRASKIAGKDTIPATVRDLTDAECQEIRLIENLQRVNIHELDEGIGYRSLRDLRPDFYTVETIAAQVAKSPAYVKGRISLTELIPAAQTAFYDGKLTVAHGLEIARLQPKDQKRALIECFPGHRRAG